MVQSTDPSGNASEPSREKLFETFRSPDRKPPMIREIRIDPSGDTARTSWKTDDPADGHTVTLTGLGPGTTATAMEAVRTTRAMATTTTAPEDDEERSMTMKSARRLLLAAILAAGIPIAATALDRPIGYSGFLTNNLGIAPIADGTCSITFSIYTVASGGTAVWTETQSVTTVTGEFSAVLGANSSNPLNLDFPVDTNYYLGIEVGANPQMSPRREFLCVPYAFREEKTETRTSDPTSPVTGQMWLIVP